LERPNKSGKLIPFCDFPRAVDDVEFAVEEADLVVFGVDFFMRWYELF
jgi:hypothetical protein